MPFLPALPAISLSGVLAGVASVSRAVLISLVASKLFGPKIEKQTGLQPVNVTTRSAIDYRKIVYGQAQVSGPIVYQNADNDAGNAIADLYTVVPVADHEIEDFVSLWLDSDAIPKADIAWTAGAAGADGTGTGAVSTAKWVGESSDTALYFQYYLGHPNQVASGQLTTVFSTDLTSNFRGRNAAYFFARQRYRKTTEKIWQDRNVSNYRALIKGKKIYDPRKDSTNGGSGTHRYTDSTTWEWSDNPALCLADYLFDVMDVDPATEIDWTAVADAADDCDVLVTIPPAGSPATTEKRFTCNGALSLGVRHRDNLESILSSMAGTLAYVGGVWRMRASVWDAASVSIPTSDIVGDVTVRGTAPLAERFNRVTGAYIDPARNYQAVEFSSVTASEFQTRDNNRELTNDLELPMTNSEYMAQRIAYRVLEQGDNQAIVEIPMNWRGAKIAVGDVFDLTFAEFGWSAKTFRCIEWVRDESGVITVTGKEDSSDRYVDPLVGEYTVKTASSITLPAILVAPISGLVANGLVDGNQLTWTNPPGRLFEVVEIHGSDDNDRANASLIPEGEVTGERTFETLKLAPRTRYYWGRTRNADGQVSDWHPSGATAGVSATPELPSLSILPDPDFDKGGAQPNIYWGSDVKQGTGPISTGALTYQATGGANSSPAYDFDNSGGSGSTTILASLQRLRFNYGKIEVRIRYQTMTNTAGGNHTNFRIRMRGFTVQAGGSPTDVDSAAFTLTRSFGSWATHTQVFDVPDTPAQQYWEMRFGFVNGLVEDTLRIDSIFVYPVTT